MSLQSAFVTLSFQLTRSILLQIGRKSLFLSAMTLTVSKSVLHMKPVEITWSAPNSRNDLSR